MSGEFGGSLALNVAQVNICDGFRFFVSSAERKIRKICPGGWRIFSSKFKTLTLAGEIVMIFEK